MTPFTPSPELDRFLSRRGPTQDEEVRRHVEATILDVETRGDDALLESARRFDSPHLETLLSDGAEDPVSAELGDALTLAAQRIQSFHASQLRALTGGMELDAGIPPEVGDVMAALEGLANFRWRTLDWNASAIGQRLRPVGRAGIYVPGGRAAYPSSVLMNALPAVAAGVRRIVVASPAAEDGRHPDAVAAAVREVEERMPFADPIPLVRCGGAAAIAAMALGTESVPRCDVVAGPGNKWVNEAKRQLWGRCGFDGYAGPSEVCVLTDHTTNARFAAADLLTQIEHAPDNVAFLVGTDEAKLREIEAEMERQTTGAPREAILRESLANGATILARDDKEACAVVDAIAPEHLTIATRDPERSMARISNAGAILLGEWTPESGGDYLIGPSHTLPTGGAARWQSPVNVMTFLLFQSVMRLDEKTSRELAPTVALLAEAEGFPAHAHGATIRHENR